MTPPEEPESLPVGLDLLAVETSVRATRGADIVLIEAGLFFTCLEESALTLARATGFRVGVDQWGRRVSGVPRGQLESRLIMLERQGLTVAVVRTVGWQGVRAQRVISSSPLPEGPVPCPDRSGGRRRTIEAGRPNGAAPVAESGGGAILSSRELSLFIRILGRRPAAEPVVEVLRDLRLADPLSVDVEWRRRHRERLLDARVGMLADCWSAYLRSGDLGDLQPLRGQEELSRLAHQILRARVQRRRGGVDWWSDSEVDLVTEMFLSGRTPSEMAAVVERPMAVVVETLEDRGLPAGLWPAWRPQDERRRGRLIRSGEDISACARVLVRSPWDVALSLIDRSG